MITIFKEDFERSLPVGASAHDEVFEAVYPAIEAALNNYYDMLLGEPGAQRVESTDENEPLKYYFKMLVCVDAFLSVFRQLDLVLTSTGFGIVSNDTISPASKQRVDALEAQLRTAQCRARAMVVQQLRSEEWGVTEQAQNFVRHIYTEHYFFFAQGIQSRSYKDWETMQRAISEAEEQLRVRFSDEQIDDVLKAYRCKDKKNMAEYGGFVQLARDFVDLWAADGDGALHSALFRRMERLVEGNPETFCIYPTTTAYSSAHMLTFSNKKESSAFLFNG